MGVDGTWDLVRLGGTWWDLGLWWDLVGLWWDLGLGGTFWELGGTWDFGGTLVGLWLLFTHSIIEVALTGICAAWIGSKSEIKLQVAT